MAAVVSRRERWVRLRPAGVRAAPIHSALMRLADRGGVSTIVTTNFDLLLEQAAVKTRGDRKGSQ